jgi:hypothetical protein
VGEILEKIKREKREADAGVSSGAELEVAPDAPSEPTDQTEREGPPADATG